MGFERLHSWVDTANAPIYVCTPPRNATVTDDEVSDFIAWWDSFVLPRREPYGVIWDLRGEVSILASQRKLLAESERRWEEYDKKYNFGQACVMSGRMTRGLVTAVYWIHPPCYPFHVFGTLEEGWEWIRKQQRLWLGASERRTGTV